MQYRGYEITIDERPEYTLGADAKVVASSRRMIYSACCALGKCFAMTPGQALADMHAVVDRELDDSQIVDPVSLANLMSELNRSLRVK